MRIKWEFPISRIESILQFEFDADAIEITDIEVDEAADALYFDVRFADSDDSERFIGSHSVGRQIDID